MIKHLKASLAVFSAAAILLSGCAGSEKFMKQKDGESIKPRGAAADTAGEKIPGEKAGTLDGSFPAESGSGKEQTAQSSAGSGPVIDLEKVKPNEAGKIMVVMFHNFVEAYKSGDKLYTTTFDDFRKLLQTLYDGGYRLINVSDYLHNRISVPAGCIPMVFTFDDGTPGQFNLAEEDGQLVASRQSAVGILEEFNKTHPDFGLKGTFYVNLGLGTFQGKGTLEERLKYLIDRGFEIGNHTLSHVNLKKVKTVEEIRKEIGGNQKRMYELIPGYAMVSFSLPYGLPSKELQQYVVKGEYAGIQYENLAVMEVGWDPAYSPVSKKFDPLSTHRVRASGIEPVDADLAWWLKKLSREEQYISDGDPDTVAIPAAREEDIDRARLNGKKLITY